VSDKKLYDVTIFDDASKQAVV